MSKIEMMKETARKSQEEADQSKQEAANWEETARRHAKNAEYSQSSQSFLLTFKRFCVLGFFA